MAKRGRKKGAHVMPHSPTGKHINLLARKIHCDYCGATFRYVVFKYDHIARFHKFTPFKKVFTDRTVGVSVH